jgi:hypothetical protein
MHVAEHTGLTGQEVVVKTEAGEIIIGKVGAECSRYFYFLEPMVSRPGEDPHRERLVTVKKTEIAELTWET